VVVDGSASAAEAPRYALEVNVEPIGSTAAVSSAFACSFVVTDLASDEVLFAPTVKVPRGESGQLRSQMVLSGESIEVDFDAHCGVDADGRQATYSLEIRESTEAQDGTLLLKYSSQVALEPEAQSGS